MWISPNRFRGPCAQALLDACGRRRLPIHLVRDGESEHFGDIGVRWHLAGRFKHSAENNGSIVTEARLGSRRLLLTGDIEAEAEEALAGQLHPASILKIAHHGSRTSSTAALLDAVRPRIALISCGRANLFGHPHPSVLDALRRRQIRSWRTDRNGTVVLQLDGARVFVRPEVDTPR